MAGTRPQEKPISVLSPEGSPEARGDRSEICDRRSNMKEGRGPPPHRPAPSQEERVLTPEARSPEPKTIRKMDRQQPASANLGTSVGPGSAHSGLLSDTWPLHPSHLGTPHPEGVLCPEGGGGAGEDTHQDAGSIFLLDSRSREALDSVHGSTMGPITQQADCQAGQRPRCTRPSASSRQGSAGLLPPLWEAPRNLQLPPAFTLLL